MILFSFTSADCSSPIWSAPRPSSRRRGPRSRSEGPRPSPGPGRSRPTCRPAPCRRRSSGRSRRRAGLLGICGVRSGERGGLGVGDRLGQGRFLGRGLGQGGFERGEGAGRRLDLGGGQLNRLRRGGLGGGGRLGRGLQLDPAAEEEMAVVRSIDWSVSVARLAAAWSAAALVGALATASAAAFNWASAAALSARALSMAGLAPARASAASFSTTIASAAFFSAASLASAGEPWRRRGPARLPRRRPRRPSCRRAACRARRPRPSSDWRSTGPC